MKAVKVDDEAYNLLEEMSRKTGTSIKDLVTKAVKLLYAGGGEVSPEKEVEEISERIITLRYPARCRRCSKELKEGDHAYYVKYAYSDKTTKTIVYCLDCYHESMITDKALAKLYVKKKELERTIKALKQEADRLAEQASVVDKIETVNRTLDSLQKLATEMVKVIPPESKESIQRMEELTATLEELRKVLADIKAVIRVRLQHTSVKAYKPQYKHSTW